MDGELSALDVLAVAERIERHGARFYRRAAGQVRDAALSALFVDLAQWESRHIEVFREVKQRLSDGSRYELAPRRLDPRDSSIMASLAVFAIQPDPTMDLHGHETKRDVLRLAVGKEEDTIIYYLGLRDFVSDEADQGIIDEVIAEEKKHVRILMQSLEQNR